jgi:predicted S18 family serine protease
MTGELTLTGHVLPIGGVREKVIAARRQKIFELILPEANRGNLRNCRTTEGRHDRALRQALCGCGEGAVLIATCTALRANRAQTLAPKRLA